MDYLSEEFIFARTGDPLEQRLWNSDRFKRQMKSLQEASRAFTRNSVKSEKCWEAFIRLEKEWIEYDVRYGEESYRLGVEDGIQLVSEGKIRAKGSVLDVKDMTHLIYMYDAIKKLNIILLGEWEIYSRDGGMLEELDRVCDVIEHGVCAKLRLSLGDKMYEYLEYILDDAGKAAEERAKKLIEYNEASYKNMIEKKQKKVQKK
ncbi:MAG: hypothetical protein K2N63_12265 [Lachnospiraceae bacterium]|nr:hypothetical protein [Lachnospiraceae bacterium]